MTWPLERERMAFGLCWWLHVNRLGVWNLGAVATLDRVSPCVLVDVSVGPWTVRAGVNR